MNEILSMSNGNSGAMSCLTSLNPIDYNIIVPILKEAEIVGTDIYVLWSDLAGKDINKMSYLCENCPIDILKDAAHRQDYSGRELVKPYLEQM